MKRENKRDVVFLCQYFYPEYVSSATLPYDTAKYLSENGYTVGALCGYPGEYCDNANVPVGEIVNGIHIRRVKYLRLGRRNKVGRCVNFLSFVIAVICHIGFLKDYKIIMVYSNPPVLPVIAMLAKKLFGCKLVFVSYDVYPEIAIRSGVMSENGIFTKLFNLYNARLFCAADAVVAVCEDMKDYLQKHRNVKERKVVSIPNWYKDDKSQNRILRSAARLFSDYSEDDFIVSYLGNLGTCQDADTIIEAIKLLKNDGGVQFIFAGHGNKIPRIKELKEKELISNLNVFEFLHGKDFSDVLKISDCYIVSLIDGLYGLCAPSKTYSYFMAGRPVICVMDERTEIAQDVVRNEAGVVVKNGDSKALAEYIKLLKNDKDMASLMSKNSRKIFLNKYEKEKCLKQYHSLIAQLLSVQKAA